MQNSAVNILDWTPGGLEVIATDKKSILGAGFTIGSENLGTDQWQSIYNETDSEQFHGQVAGYVAETYLDHSTRVIHVRLPRPLPRIVLDSKGNNFAGITNLGVRFDETQHIKLEGDFDNYFSVYAPAGTEVLALQLLSPNVMESLRNSATHVDIETNGQNLFVFIPKHQSVDHTVTSALEITKTILNNFQHFEDNIFAMIPSTSLEDTSLHIEKFDLGIKIGSKQVSGRKFFGLAIFGIFSIPFLLIGIASLLFGVYELYVGLSGKGKQNFEWLTVWLLFGMGLMFISPSVITVLLALKKDRAEV